MAVAYKFVEADYIGLPDMTANGTTQLIPLGTIAKAKDTSSSSFGEAEFRYTKFTGTTVAGDFVIFAAGDNTCVQAAGAIQGQIGISMAAQANGQFGWVMVRGIHDGANIATGGAAGNPLYTSATAGRGTTTAVAGQAILPAFLRIGAAASNIGTAELWWPSVLKAV